MPGAVLKLAGACLKLHVWREPLRPHARSIVWIMLMIGVRACSPCLIDDNTTGKRRHRRRWGRPLGGGDGGRLLYTGARVGRCVRG